MAGAIVALTLLVARAWRSRSLPDLRLWHRTVLRSEIHARDLPALATLADYQAREETVFRELRERVFDRVPAAERVKTSRYTAGGPLDPATFTHDWNRTFAMEPVAGTLRGGVLLVHGLTDAPYSLRAVGEIYRRQGFYALAVRMPGHGTVPAALTDVVWEDWLAVVRLGARAVRARIGPTLPFEIVGYSNGGALALEYALAARADSALPRPERIVLLSPMVGVSRYAALARLTSRLAVIPFFEKSRWVDVYPEYIPFKYNSFPANAAFQTHRLTSALKRDLGRAASRRGGGGLPPILAFQSVVDATVDVGALVHQLFDRLEANGSELVLFDYNRASGIQPFLRVRPEAALGDLAPGAEVSAPRRFRSTLITNAGSRPDTVHEASRPAGATAVSERPLDLRWPDQVFSLSHVALPFPLSDPLYGLFPDLRESFGVRLGLVVPRGERNVLLLVPESSVRLYSNPFFPYVEERLQGWISVGAPPP